ncbi:hypothetical protein [Actinomadura coerulea]
MAILPELRAHLDSYAEPGPDGRVFAVPKGGAPQASVARRSPMGST